MTQIDEKKLEMCPFDQGKAVLHIHENCYGNRPMFEIECTKCRISKSWPDKDVLINNWNTRTAPPHHITVTIDTRTHKVVEINSEGRP